MNPGIPASSEHEAPHPDSRVTLLNEVRRQAAERLGQGIARALQTVTAELDALDRACAPGDGRHHDLGLANAWRELRDTIEARVQKRLEEAFQQCVRGTRPSPHAFSETRAAWTELSLMADGDLEETVRLGDMAGRLRDGADEELAAFDQRMAWLIPVQHPRPEDNPLGPETICDALRASLTLVRGDRTLRLLLIAAFQHALSETLLPLYQSLNGLLRQNGVLPHIRYGDTKNPVPGSGPGTGPRVTSAAVATEDANLATLLKRVLMAMDARPAATPGEALGPAPSPVTSHGVAADIQPPTQPLAPPEVMTGKPAHAPRGELLHALALAERGERFAADREVLEALQWKEDSQRAPGAAHEPGESSLSSPGEAQPVNALRKLGRTPLAARLDPMDALTLDMVALLFEQIVADTRITPPMRMLIHRLQVPVLKAALLDRTFFSVPDHPARRTLDLLGNISRTVGDRLPASGALSQRLEALVERTSREFDGDLGVFHRATTELHSLWRNATLAAKRHAQRVQERERLDTARQCASDALRARVAGHAIPRPVLHFLATEWLKLMIFTYATSGPDSRGWQNALETLENLLWTLTPKQSLPERHRLGSLLPQLLKSLHKGMAAIGTAEPVKERFIAALMRGHARTIGAGAQEAIEAPAIAAKPPAAATAARSSTSKPAAVAALPVAGSNATPLTLAEKHGDSTATAPLTLAEKPVGSHSAMEKKPAASTSTEPHAAPPAVTAEAPPMGKPQPARVPVAIVQPAPPAATPRNVPPAAPAVTVPNPFGDGEIEFEEVSFGEPAAPVTAAPADRHTQAVAKLREGDWIELREESDSAPVQARLSHVDNQRGAYQFADRKGQRIAEYSLFQLTCELRSGRIVLLDSAPTPGRAASTLGGLLRKGGGRSA